MIKLVLIDTRPPASDSISFPEYYFIKNQAEHNGYIVTSTWSMDGFHSFIDFDNDIDAIEFKLLYL